MQSPSSTFPSSAIAAAATAAAVASVPSQTLLNHEPTPLSPPTALIIGVSIVQHIHFAIADTLYFHGATTINILEKVPDLLESAPPTLTEVTLHCGTNDTIHTPLKLTKTNFAQLFNILNKSGKFISGPLPTQGLVRFALTGYCISTACYNLFAQHIASTSLDMFWDLISSFGQDGLHLTKTGCHILAAKLLHAVHYAQNPLIPGIHFCPLSFFPSPSSSLTVHHHQNINRLKEPQTGLPHRLTHRSSGRQLNYHFSSPNSIPSIWSSSHTASSSLCHQTKRRMKLSNICPFA